MNAEFFKSLELLAAEKGIPQEYMMEKVEAALTSAYKREFAGNSNVRVVIDPVKKDLKMYQVREVVANDFEVKECRKQALYRESEGLQVSIP